MDHSVYRSHCYKTHLTPGNNQSVFIPATVPTGRSESSFQILRELQDLKQPSVKGKHIIGGPTLPGLRWYFVNVVIKWLGTGSVAGTEAPEQK